MGVMNPGKEPIMANIKTITKKLINNGYSENKLMMMTEKEIREAYKTLKEDNSMNKTIKVRRDSHESFESWIDRINKLLSSNDVHLDNDRLLTIVDDEETDYVSIEDGLINVHGWCAGEPYYCCYDFNGNLKQYSNEGTNFELVEVKEESIMNNNTNNTATNNSASVVKEEIAMRELVNNTINRIETTTKVQDVEYVTRDELADIMEQLTGVRPGKKVTRKQMVQDLYVLEDDLQQIENAEMDSDNSIAVGDLDITNDNAPESIEESTITVKNPATEYDAKALTYKLMHKIGDHAIANRKKGFGTTISAKMLCALIVEIASLNDPEPIDRLYVPTGKKDKYGRDITMVNPKITEEHKNKCKDVRKWLLDNGYIKTVTFKDEKGFVFYTPEYDGNRKDKMYDATKFQSTGKIETTTYRVTKEMNKWYK